MADLTKAQEAEVKKEVAEQVQKRESKILQRLKSGTGAFKNEFHKQTITAIIAAFGLVIALSWQTVIKGIIESIPKKGILLYHPYITDIYTAIVVTIIAVIAILILSRWAQNPQ